MTFIFSPFFFHFNQILNFKRSKKKKLQLQIAFEKYPNQSRLMHNFRLHSMDTIRDKNNVEKKTHVRECETKKKADRDKFNSDWAYPRCAFYNAFETEIICARFAMNPLNGLLLKTSGGNLILLPRVISLLCTVHTLVFFFCRTQQQQKKTHTHNKNGIDSKNRMSRKCQFQQPNIFKVIPRFFG